jgi:hypothetical protein
MTRIEIDELRSRYEAAFEVFRTHTTKLIANSKGGQQPTPQDLAGEEEALYKLNRARRDLLEALNRVY